MTLFNTSYSQPDAAQIRIAVVDDHSIMRAVYRSLVDDSPEYALVWSASSLDEARMHLQRNEVPDVIIMDVTLPDGTGYELVQEILLKHPDILILMVSAHEEISYARHAVECGARGYLVKDCSPTELMDALETVLSGERYFRPEPGMKLG